MYDGRGEFKGVCINDFFEIGTDLFNSFADILARLRLCRYGMMAELIKCFFQINLTLYQRDLFRILWFDDHDIGERQVKVFQFTRHPWGLKSSPFIASCAIQKTLEENATGSSDLTRKLVQKNIYTDDLIFSVNNLDDTRVIANEAIDLFDSRGFRLVKWSVNKEVDPELSKFNKDVLAAEIRELDLPSFAVVSRFVIAI